MVWAEEDQPTGTPAPDINILWAPRVILVSDTSIKLRISTLGMSGKSSVTSYKVTYQKMLNEKTTGGSVQVINSPVTSVTLYHDVLISGLVPNSKYRITAQALSATGEGNIQTILYELKSEISIPSKEGSTKEVGEGVSAKSYLKLTGGETSDNVYTLAYKDFESIDLGSYTEETIGTGNSEKPVRNYSPAKYYSFGTSVIFPPLNKYKPQGAGIGFFIDDTKEYGYFISLETSSTAATSSTSPVKIFKLIGKQRKKLADTQRGNVKTLDQLFAGTVYNVDVKVKVFNKSVTITAYVNGFKIEATDTSSAAKDNEILYPTKKIGLVGISGTSYFDYVYAETISENLYNSDYQNLNFYNGQFSKDFIDTAYGDLLYNASNEDVDMIKKKKSFDEFGTVVREIAKRQISFPSAPAIPIKWTTGANRLAKIVAQDFDNFKAEVLVLNNSSITVPLSDRGVNQLSIFGNTIGFSGQIEYDTSLPAGYSSPEPAIFESLWLQNSVDVEALASWIQGKIVNRAKVITMKVFGNPLISVGDMISIDYPYQGVSPDERIIVVKVTHSFEGGGLTTELVGRTL